MAYSRRLYTSIIRKYWYLKYWYWWKVICFLLFILIRKKMWFWSNYNYLFVRNSAIIYWIFWILLKLLFNFETKDWKWINNTMEIALYAIAWSLHAWTLKYGWKRWNRQQKVDSCIRCTAFTNPPDTDRMKISRLKHSWNK